MKQHARRHAQARRMLVAELTGKHPEWSDRRRKQEADLILRREHKNPYFADEYINVAPAPHLPEGVTVSREVEARAWVEHPAMQWLMQVVCNHPNGRPGERRKIEVRVSAKDARVRARPAYVVPRPPRS